MKFTQDNTFAGARRFNLSQVRMALLATTAIVAVAGAGTYAKAQAVIDGGMVVNVPGTHASPWDIGNYIIVGDVSAGTLNIGVGGVAGEVKNFVAIIGNDAVSNGVVNVTGPGSLWTSADTVTIGNDGNGLVAISSGGQANFFGTYLGVNAGSSGILTVDGNGSSLSAGSFLSIGDHGNGAVTVSNGAKAAANGAYIGVNAGSSGVATITGAGSALSLVNNLIVGYTGKARLTISDGGAVSNSAGFIGYGASDAAVTVTGSGSTWTNSADLHVGHEGAGNLTIADGGAVTNVNGFISYNGLITGNSSFVTVTGAGSTWTNTGMLVVAEVGNGGLRIENGGAVTALEAYVGENTGGKGSVEIDGSGSKLTIANELTVGRLDDGYMTITHGGLVSNGGDGFIGYGGSGIGQVTVDGAGSQWANGNILYVGYYGQGELHLLNGGAASATYAAVAGLDSGSTGAVTVDGAGSKLTSQGIFVGYAGTGTLAISNGGSVDSGAGYGVLGYQPGSNGMATVDGTNSKWTMGADLAVGFAGTGSLTIANGASVAVGGTARIANGPASSGTLNIGAAEGSPAVAAGTLDAAILQFGGGLGAINFNHTDSNYVFSPIIGGNGAINQLAGVTRLTADSSPFFVGPTTISGGTLLVDGTIGGGPVTVQSGGTLGGMGTIGGPVTVDNGGTLLGVEGQTLSMQSLGLSAGSNVDVTLTTPGGAALFDVANNLTLDGTLNITSGGGFGPGIYHVMTYGGTLTDNGMVIGSTPSGTVASDFAVQTAVAGQVNLINGMAPTMAFWDGDGAGSANNNMVDGGSGVWTATSSNWTTYTGATNGAMQPQPGFAIFQGMAGTVTADAGAGALAVTGMQFASDGYRIEGAPITLADPSSIIRVGDGSAGGATYEAIIASALTGSGGLVKTDLGTLILTGANSYTGGTTISGGTLQIGNGAASGSIMGNVTNNGVLAFSRSDATTFGGTISGSGAVKLLTGDVTLTAANSYAGGTDIAAGSTLRLGNGGATGSITGNVSNNGALVFNRSDDASFAGIISGAGDLSQIGAGTTQLTGDSSAFTGATTISSGALLVDGTLGGGPVTVQSGGTLGGMGTIGGTVAVASGGTLLGVEGQTLTTGTLALASGSNVNVLLGAPGNTAGLFNVSGNLTLDGTLNVTDAGGFGQGIYRIFDYSGSLTDNGMSVGTIPAGTGTIQTAMANQVNLVVDIGGSQPIPTMQFWNGTTTIADGTIHGGNGTWSAGPTTNWTDANGATAAAWAGKFAVFQGNPGSVTVDGAAGKVAATGMQFIGAGWSVAGAPITLNGLGGTTTIRVGDGSAGGANDNATIASELTGSSGLNKTDLGTLILTGANSYAGGTVIAAGTLQIGNGGASGSISGNVTNNGILAFSRSNDFTYGGAISGDGAINQIGSGRTILTGDSSAFTGTTDVMAGALVVNGTLGGSVTIGDNGRIGGSGTVGNIVVNGTIAPGNSIGTLHVGTIAFNAGSIYEVEVNAAGQSDKIAASGAATINGGSVQVLAGAGNYMPKTQYTILTASGGVIGGFNGVTANLAFLDPSLSYGADTVFLTMTRNDIGFQTIGQTPNQIAAAGGVESLGFGNPVYDAVLNLSAPQAQYAFDQLSGEIHASAKTALIEDSRFVRNAIIDRIRAAFDGVVTDVDGKPVATATDPLALWGQGFGSWGQTDGNGNAATLVRKTGGFIVGADASVFDTWRFGAVAGYGASQFDVKDRHASGTSDAYHLGLYGGTQWGDLAFRTGAAYTWYDLSTVRGVMFQGLGDSLKGDYNAASAQIFGELAYGFDIGGVRLEPFANLAYVTLHTGRFTETGGAAALTSPSSDTDATFTTLGLRATTTFDMGGATLTAKGMFGWRYAFGDVTPLSAMHFASGGDAFEIGVPIARNAAVIEAGLDYDITPNATLGITYGGEFGSGIADQSLKASFNVKF